MNEAAFYIDNTIKIAFGINIIYSTSVCVCVFY